MQFRDRVLLRLTDAAERAAVFTTPVGGALLAATYAFDEVAVGDTRRVDVRAVTLAPVVHPLQVLAGTARDASSASWQLSVDLPAGPAVACHAVVEVEVVTATRGVQSEIIEVSTQELSSFADLEAVDALVRAADGGLSDDPAVLDRRRFEELRHAVAGRFEHVPETAVASALASRGVTDVRGLLALLSPPQAVGRLALTVVTDATAPERDRAYRLTTLVQVVDDLSTGLLTGLQELGLGRATLSRGADPLPTPAGMSVREPYPAVLVFPVAGLDDDDLPSGPGPAPGGQAAQRAARLGELTTRLRAAAVVPVGV